MKVTQENDNLNHKKVPVFDDISPGLVKELSRKAYIILTYISNISSMNIYAQETQQTFKKLQVNRLKPLAGISDFQFVFRNHN